MTGIVKQEFSFVDEESPEGVAKENAEGVGRQPDHAADRSMDIRPSRRSDRDASVSFASLPRHISGGFKQVADDLDQRSRDAALMVRLLEQLRLQLESSEMEGARLYAQLDGTLPSVQKTSKALQERIVATKLGDVSANLSALFSDNLKVLDELENISKALTANLLWTRSNWEQYARGVISAEKMRQETQRGNP